MSQTGGDKGSADHLGNCVLVTVMVRTTSAASRVFAECLLDQRQQEQVVRVPPETTS